MSIESQKDNPIQPESGDEHRHIEDLPIIPVQAVEDALHFDEWRRANYPQATNSFETMYSKAGVSVNELLSKCALAKALIEDGRYPNKELLVSKFIPSGEQISEDILKIAQELRAQLKILLIKRDEMSVRSPEAKECEDYLAGEFERSREMDDLVKAGVPIEVVGQIMTVEKFNSLTDMKKMEEMRSWVTHAILRPYLGKLSGTLPRSEINALDLIDRIPKKVFSHPYTVRYNLIEHFVAGRFREMISATGLSEGMQIIEKELSTISDPERQQFMEKIYETIYDEVTLPLKGGFKPKISVKDQEKEFPSSEQRAFCYGFIKHNTRLLTAETGLGKTGTAFLAMENSDAEKVLVLVPAKGKQSWFEQDKVVFENPGNVFIVRGSADLHNVPTCGKKYIVISHELLGRAQKYPKFMENLVSAVEQAGIDGAVIDEIDGLSNPDTISVKTTRQLLKLIRKNHQDKKGNDDAPVIGLTATPISKGVEDLNIPMAMLYPEKYAATCEETTSEKKTFSDTCLKSPHSTYITLIGEKRMFRWESAAGMQEFSALPTPEPVKLSPFEKMLCEFIYSELGGDSLNKIRLLENAVFNPLLVKAELRTILNGQIPEIDLDEVLENLKTSVSNWKKIRGIDAPQSTDDYLSADKLVELGMGDMVLGCFFSGVLENGIDTLVEELTLGSIDPDLVDLKAFWKSREISSKYQVLKEKLSQSLSWRTGEDGSLTRDKVIIISPSRMQGRTGDVLQRIIKTEDGKERPLYEVKERETINDLTLKLLLKEWAKDSGWCDEECILLLDGSVPIGNKRDRLISKWVNDPTIPIFFVTLEAAYQSRDFTINQLEDSQGRKIGKVRNIFLGPTWDFPQLKQMIGRSVRQGHLVPVENLILEAQDVIDQGKSEGVRYSYLLSRMALSGATLFPEDQEFFDSKRIGARILRYQNADTRFLRDAFNLVVGAGEKVAEEALSNADRHKMAEKYLDGGRDEFKKSGYNAEMVAHLINRLGYSDRKILSLGAGTLLLQRKLQRGIDNVDMNPYMMEAGWSLAAQYGGRTITAKTSELQKETFPDKSYDFIDYAFAFHWSQLQEKGNPRPDTSERVKILSQVHRMLKDKGILALTLPEKAFNDETFSIFTQALERHFGFKMVNEYCGKSYGIGQIGTKTRLGWSILAQKAQPVSLEGLNLADLRFGYDDRTWVSEYQRETDGVVGTDRDAPNPDIHLQLEQYWIVNGRGVKTVLNGESAPAPAGTPAVEPVPAEQDAVTTDSKIVIDLDYLRGETEEDYSSFRRELIRPLQKITGLSWAEAEPLSLDILSELIKKGRLPRNRLLAYSWILKEAKRLQNNGRG